ncbi:UDP-4-amino-4,6-dideoxy-N-acetyl-beta-L-altrosamine transaminase [Saccharobesus litoralis]|uniref:UDP-4-amino-4, 6-dideoxy-N-acetyl-beta-L-altrosamine transaminase n=1 Tax=Saccharobesus litoralis TaxID=2172099 RepID=A0A2S0VUB4_9ALTE|nr:UDP-4-amino-4,6-dideoxy-N-acetyl-beta-L-altrosamine transaminase [Saccharobesus litoralis]AWB67795.1 UDP-4-amino-4,6-dideoxy-N-acetyl-beta-L-altrosamine transaminase [Saccharobesus litoralis]
MIPYGKQDIIQADIDAVVDVLQNQFLTQGTQVPAFEKAISEYCNVEYCIAVNSGTSALHVACLALDIGEGDLVWTTPITFVASANCARYCGADIDFVDIDPVTRNLSITQLAEKLEIAEKANRLPKALVCVHYAGQSCDMQAINQLGQRYGFKIIEDASHALGAKYQNKLVGNCQYSDCTVFSFHPVKPITTAEGGALVTNNSALYQKATLHAKHGVTRDDSLLEPQYRSVADGDWYYQQIELGYNYRLSDIHAALGLSQLQRIDTYIQRRLHVAERYQHAFEAQSTTLPQLTLPQLSVDSGWHLYVVELPFQLRKLAFDYFRTHKIGVNVHYIPVHLQPYYQKLGFKQGDFPHAESFYAGAITLPIHPNLTLPEQEKVISCMRDFLTSVSHQLNA